MSTTGSTIDWQLALRRYLAALLALNLVWEVAQLPLYTLWRTESLKQQAFAVAHCTIGDLMIAGLTLLVAIAVLVNADWPRTAARPVWLLTLALGVGYTIYSEWVNVSVRGNWAYSDLMPIVPFIGTGVAPLLQWVVVPTLAFWFATSSAPWREFEGMVP
jgi:tellurite resistance protein TehA-like permease